MAKKKFARRCTLFKDCHRYGNHRSLPGASETNPVDFMRLEEETPKMAGTEQHSYIKRAYLQAWPRISTRDNREQLQQVARARLDPGTTGLRVRRADHTATLPTKLEADSFAA